MVGSAQDALRGRGKRKRGVPAHSPLRSGPAASDAKEDSLDVSDAIDFLTVPPLAPDDDDTADWRLFLAALEADDANLDQLFPEDEDQEYQLSGSDADDPTEEYRNDRAVHIPRKEVNEIKRLADKELGGGGVATRSRARRHGLNEQQEARLKAVVARLYHAASHLHDNAATRTDVAAAMGKLEVKMEEADRARAARGEGPSEVFSAETRKGIARMLRNPAKLPRRRKGAQGPPQKTPFKNQFSAVEDKLLVWGLHHFSVDTQKSWQQVADWDLIREHCLPVYTAKQVLLRFRNLSGRDKPNAVKAWRESRALSQVHKPRGRTDRSQGAVHYVEETLDDSGTDGFESEWLADTDEERAASEALFLSDSGDELFASEVLPHSSPETTRAPPATLALTEPDFAPEALLAPAQQAPTRRKRLTIMPRTSPKKKIRRK